MLSQFLLSLRARQTSHKLWRGLPSTSNLTQNTFRRYSQIPLEGDQRVFEPAIGPNDKKSAEQVLLNWQRQSESVNPSTQETRMFVVATTMGRDFDLGGIQKYLYRFGFSSELSSVPNKPYLRLEVNSSSDVKPKDPTAFYFMLWLGKDKEIFWFPNGTFVGWGIDEMGRASLEVFSKSFCNHKLPEAISQQMPYTLGTHLRFFQDVFILPVTQHTKLSISFGLSRSAKLLELEKETEEAVLKIPKEGLGYKERAHLARDHLFHLVQIRDNLRCGHFNDTDHLDKTVYDQIENRLALEQRYQFADNRLQLPITLWQTEQKHSQLESLWRIEQVLIAILLSLIISFVLSKSEWCQGFTLEKYFGDFWKRAKKSLGVSKHPAGTYEIIVEETYEVVPNQKPKP